ncbi:hypothetical protein O6H91_12G021000 [Diphasiastrum complanatum]|uniref:Uncharacterized protein n=1 Tax=Diphasiastrum complanatum TaxID=34168 RepID=A0ACC2BZE7_DIPCM|nr:hypothetical protein O6H91_12G021000 [Diphasiastrum complanatum]
MGNSGNIVQACCKRSRHTDDHCSSAHSQVELNFTSCKAELDLSFEKTCDSANIAERCAPDSLQEIEGSLRPWARERDCISHSMATSFEKSVSGYNLDTFDAATKSTRICGSSSSLIETGNILPGRVEEDQASPTISTLLCSNDVPAHVLHDYPNTAQEEDVAVSFSGSDHERADCRCMKSSSCPPHGLVSLCGRRREMEDAVAAVPSFLHARSDVAGPSCNYCSSKGSKELSSLHFFGVYDGHGGSQASLLCKDRLHHALAEEVTTVLATWSPGSVLSATDLTAYWQKAMVACFSKVDAEVDGNTEMRPDCEASASIPETVGSTAVVAVVGPSQIIVGNCGDSRAVLSRGGKAIALSKDHKPDREDELARVEAAGGHVIFWNGFRVLGVLAMSRAIGDRYLKPFIIPEPEVTCTPRMKDDECLILASDGLWDVLSNEEACDIARRCLAGHCRYRNHPGSPDNEIDNPLATAAAAILAKVALSKGSMDNISVVVVDLKDR